MTDLVKLVRRIWALENDWLDIAAQLDNDRKYEESHFAAHTGRRLGRHALDLVDRAIAEADSRRSP